MEEAQSASSTYADALARTNRPIRLFLSLLSKKARVAAVPGALSPDTPPRHC